MFKNLFKKSEPSNTDINRIALTSEDQIDELLNLSYQKSVLLFKHSSRCGISSMVLKRFENKIKQEQSEFAYYFLDLLQHRNISNMIANKLNVPHQSPQLIIIKNGRVTNHSSHYGIVDLTL